MVIVNKPCVLGLFIVGRVECAQSERVSGCGAGSGVGLRQHGCIRCCLIAGVFCSTDRQVHFEMRQLQNVQRNILDGDLLWRFLYLSSAERAELAKRIGTSNDQVSRRSCCCLGLKNFHLELRQYFPESF